MYLSRSIVLNNSLLLDHLIIQLFHSLLRCRYSLSCDEPPLRPSPLGRRPVDQRFRNPSTWLRSTILVAHNQSSSSSARLLLESLIRNVKPVTLKKYFVRLSLIQQRPARRPPTRLLRPQRHRARLRSAASITRSFRATRAVVSTRSLASRLRSSRDGILA